MESMNRSISNRRPRACPNDLPRGLFVIILSLALCLTAPAGCSAHYIAHTSFFLIARCCREAKARETNEQIDDLDNGQCKE